MNSKHNNRKNMLSIVFLLAIMLIIPFSSSLSEDIKPDKIKINHNIKDNKNVYENEYISITSDIDNTIDLTQAILNDKYISIPKYDKKKSSSNYELKFYTGNDGVTYDIYKSDLTDVSKNKVKETGYLFAKAVSKNNYVTISTNGFSSLILTIPNFEIPFYNTHSLYLNQYFSNFDYFEVDYFDPLDWVNDSTITELTLSEGQSSLNTDYFEVNLYKVSTDVFLDTTMYESPICWDSNSSCIVLNTIVVRACETGGVNCVENSFQIDAPDTFNYYTSPNTKHGLHQDMVDYFDFNTNLLHSDQSAPFTYSRFDHSTQFNNYPSSWSNTYGVIGGAFDYDGSTDYVDDNINAFTSANIVSVSLWFKTNTIQQSTSLFGSNSASYTDVRVIDLRNDPLIRVQRVDGVTDHLEYAVDYSDNVWHHVVYTEDSTNGAKLYFDGVLRDSTTYMDFSNNIEPYIGARNDNGATIVYFDGYIDEVGLFNRELTASEISYMYNARNSREFHTLNSPVNVNDGFCFGNSSTYCDTYETSKYNFGELQSTQTIYLSQFFVYDDTMTYEVEYFNEDTDSFVLQGSGLTTGLSFTYDEYGMALVGEKLDISYFGTSTEAGFADARIWVYNDFGYEDYVYYTITYPQIPTTPPAELIPVSTLWNTGTGFDLNLGNISIDINNHYINYTDLEVTYYDENLGDNVSYFISLTMDRNDGIITTETGNISVELDSQSVAGNIVVTLAEIEGKTYNGDMTLNISNAAGSLTTTFNIISGEVVGVVDLIKANIGNKSVAYTEMVCVDTADYFYNVSKVSVLFEYENVSYNQTQLYNFGLVGPPTAITNETTGFIAYTTELAVFCFEAKEINLSQYITMIVYDNLSNSAQQNFYINVVASIPMTEAQSYLANLGSFISGLFPDASSLSTLESLSIVIGVILIVSILILVMTFKQFGVTSIYITLGVDILLFLLFAGLNYISTGFLVLIALLLIGLSYLKIRSS